MEDGVRNLSWVGVLSFDEWRVFGEEKCSKEVVVGSRLTGYQYLISVHIKGTWG